MSEIQKDDFMTETDESHEEFLMFVNTPFAVENLKMNQAPMRAEVKKMSTKVVHNGEKSFLEWIYKVTAGEFYLMTPPGHISHFGLLKRNLKALMLLAYCKPSNEHKHFYDGYDRVIEIVNLDSAEKGEGYKSFKRLSMLADKLENPISLWTEIEGNVPIFERYGFINKGRIGIKNEFLMIRFPEGK